jgi:hypothetical protein
MSYMSLLRQRPVKGGRKYKTIAIHPKIYAELIRQSQKFNVTPSFIGNTALMEQLGVQVKDEEKYYEVDR